MLKYTIQATLEYYVRQYLRRNKDIKVVIVVGSVGKTSTKNAIATVLKEKFRVRVHTGNHNAELSAPLAILGIEYPKSLRNPKVWMDIFRQAEERIKQPADVDVIVQEVGSDRVGQVPQFGEYVKPDIAVVSSVSPEHMEYFKTLDAVAAEELSPANFSKKLILNTDDIDKKYRDKVSHSDISTYGLSVSDYSFIKDSFSTERGYKGVVKLPEERSLNGAFMVIGDQSIKSVLAGVAVADQLGVSEDEIESGLKKVHPVPGRMNPLDGKKDSLLLDDSYNSSPSALMAALHTLYELESPQKIAVLGSMNELGHTSAREHRAVGAYCQPDQLDLVITVGDEAKSHLAPAALKKGCHVMSFDSALAAGEYLLKNLKNQAIVLFKGSEGGVYLEEAVKMLLKDSVDEQQLVRQSDYWLEKKSRYFDSI